MPKSQKWQLSNLPPNVTVEKNTSYIKNIFTMNQISMSGELLSNDSEESKKGRKLGVCNLSNVLTVQLFSTNTFSPNTSSLITPKLLV